MVNSIMAAKRRPGLGISTKIGAALAAATGIGLALLVGLQITSAWSDARGRFEADHEQISALMAETVAASVRFARVPAIEAGYAKFTRGESDLAEIEVSDAKGQRLTGWRNEAATPAGSILEAHRKDDPGLVGIDGFTLVKLPILQSQGGDKVGTMSLAWGHAAMRRDLLASARLQLGIALVGFFGLQAMLYVLLRWIAIRPIQSLTRCMSQLAVGDLQTVIPGAARRDEIGAIAQAVQVFKDSALEKREMEQRAASDRHAAEQERNQTEADRKARADQQAGVVASLAEALGQLAAGDLTCDLNDAFAVDYERLRTDFNAAVGELRHAIGAIVVSTNAIRSGTGEISHAADDLSRRTEQQAASLEQTAAALDEITATVQKTSGGAHNAKGLAAAAKADAESGEAVVRDAVGAMSAIEQSSREISQIIGVIDEIAFQTNLLALNAGVEAARAGDSGRGFAVVASEVRALAQRSAEAAKEIKRLISSSTSHVGRGVTLVNETGAALSRILGRATEISIVVAEIAASAQEQASGLAEVNTAVNRMDQVTQQNAAMVEQSTAASHSLAHDTTELETLTARFKTGTEAADPTRLTHSGVRDTIKARAKDLRVVGNTARKPEVEEESWQEF